jgi:hypothetical protein
VAEVQIVEKKPAVQKLATTTGVITVDFGTTVDLKRIDRHVKSMFSEIISKVKSKEEELYDLVKATVSGIEEQVMIEYQKIAIKEEIELLSSKAQSFEYYFDYSKVLLEQYSELVPDLDNRVIGEQKMMVNDEKLDDFQLIVSEFVSLAMQFTEQIKLVSQTIGTEKCHCGGIIMGGTSHCSTCGADLRQKDAGKNQTGVKCEYYRAETFEEYIDECQGRRKKPIPPEVYETIMKHCARMDIKEQSLTKADILRILKKYKMSDYYKSINLIAHVLIQTALPDIQRFRTALMERHHLIEKEYFEIRDSEGRSNFLYAWFVLRACLSMEGYDANPDDFVSLTTRDAALDHNKFMTRICDRIRQKQKLDSSIKGNWKFNPIR